LSLLGDMQERFETSARNLPELESLADLWQGLAFTVSGTRLVSAMTAVSEMLALPPMITRVPGTKPWIVGIANVRGTLLPITDLQAYLGAKPLAPNKSSRILVVRHDANVTGLLVASVLGMHQFRPDQHRPNVRVDGIAGAYVYDAYQVDDEFWPVFDIHALTSDPKFIAAAA
jgi:twitching motility protein PilI